MIDTIELYDDDVEGNKHSIGTLIRITPDGLISVFDVIEILEYTKNPRTEFSRLCNDHPELLSDSGQDVPVVTLSHNWNENQEYGEISSFDIIEQDEEKEK